jgi:hypothetical protein
MPPRPSILQAGKRGSFGRYPQGDIRLIVDAGGLSTGYDAVRENLASSQGLSLKFMLESPR